MCLFSPRYGTLISPKAAAATTRDQDDLIPASSFRPSLKYPVKTHPQDDTPTNQGDRGGKGGRWGEGGKTVPALYRNSIFVRLRLSIVPLHVDLFLFLRRFYILKKKKRKEPKML